MKKFSQLFSQFLHFCLDHIIGAPYKSIGGKASGTSAIIDLLNKFGSNGSLWTLHGDQFDGFVARPIQGGFEIETIPTAGNSAIFRKVSGTYKVLEQPHGSLEAVAFCKTDGKIGVAICLKSERPRALLDEPASYDILNFATLNMV